MELLRATLVTEPERQRLGRFVLEVATDLGAEGFAAAGRLWGAMDRIHRAWTVAGEPLDVRLVLREGDLALHWTGGEALLYQFARAPDPKALDQAAERLRDLTESSDPELLRQRNREISHQLEQAQDRADRELEQLESLLQAKQDEVQEYLHRAESDSLTGLLNRGAFEKRLREGVLRCQRQGEPLCLILLDLDHFKEINDGHGHLYGDRYLQFMAEAMNAVVREHVDLPFRFGGDEFGIIAFAEQDTARSMAQRVFDRLDGRTSIGVACLRDGDTPDSLTNRADLALYRAKDLGRGSIVGAEEATID